MRVDARILRDHLKRLRVPARERKGIHTAVLGEGFESQALNEEGTLLVSAPPLEVIEPLSEEIGVELRVFIGSVKMAKTASVDLSIQGNRLVIPQGEGATDRLLLSNLELVESRVAPEVAEEMFERFQTSEGVPLSLLPWDEAARAYLKEGEGPRETITHIVPSSVDILKAAEVRLSVGPDGGDFTIRSSKVRVTEPGMLDSHETSVRHHLTAPKPFELTFDAETLASLLRVLRRARGVRVHLSGPRGPILFSDDEGFRWLIRPKEALRTV